MKTRRTREERIHDVEEKIEWHENHIKNLKEKLEILKNPPAPKRGKVGMATVVRKAKENGISANQLLEMMNAVDNSKSN